MTTPTDQTTGVLEPQKPPVVDAQEVVEPSIAEATATPTAPTTPAPTTPVSPAPVVDPQLQAYIAALEQQVREAKVRADSEAIATSIAARQQELVNEYALTPDQALAIAQREGRLAKEAATKVTEATAKMAYAAKLADEHKVPIASLLQYNTPQAMDEAVARVSTESQQAARIAALEAEVAALKKGQVPPQSFDNGRGQPPSSGGDYMERLRSGKPLPSAREIDEDTARFLRSRAS